MFQRHLRMKCKSTLVVLAGISSIAPTPITGNLSLGLGPSRALVVLIAAHVGGPGQSACLFHRQRKAF